MTTQFRFGLANDDLNTKFMDSANSYGLCRKLRAQSTPKALLNAISGLLTQCTQKSFRAVMFKNSCRHHCIFGTSLVCGQLKSELE